MKSKKEMVMGHIYVTLYALAISVIYSLVMFSINHSDHVVKAMPMSDFIKYCLFATTFFSVVINLVEFAVNFPDSKRLFKKH